MQKFVALCLVLLLGMSTAGCSTFSGGVAPSNVPLDPDSYTRTGRVSGTSWGVYILWLIPVAFPSTQEALDSALRGGNGRPIVQVTADTRKYYRVPLMYLERIKVEGVATQPAAGK